MNIDRNARYSKSHEWVRAEGGGYVYGITDHAQHELSDLVYIELPAIGAKFGAGDIIGTVESVKAASDLYLPMSGEVTEVNEALTATPEKMNQDPYGEGWIAKFKATDPAEWDQLMTSDAYEAFSGD